MDRSLSQKANTDAVWLRAGGFGLEMSTLSRHHFAFAHVQHLVCPPHVAPAVPAIEEALAGAVVTGGIVTRTPRRWD